MKETLNAQIVQPDCELDWHASSTRLKLAGTGLKKRMQQRTNERELREQLTRLRAEHRELDDEIVTLEATGTADQLQIKRLKKKKLGLKDQITAVEDQLLPDIIA